MRIRLLLRILADSEAILGSDKHSLKEQQRTQRIVLEAIDKISKMKDLGSKEDDLAKMLERLTKLVGKGNGNGKTEKKNGDSERKEVHA
jgi:hypothetical protein